MIANPFPEAIHIQNIQSSDLPGIDPTTYDFHTEIRIWNGGGYDTYGWSDADDGTDINWEESNSKWLDQKQENIVDVTIGIGEGFWIKTDAPGKITFTK